MSPVLRAFYIHHIPELESRFYVELCLEVAFCHIHFCAEMHDLANIGLARITHLLLLFIQNI